MLTRAILVSLAAWVAGAALQAQRTPPASPPTPLPPAALEAMDADAIRARLRFLADDLLEGRAPGTRGGELASRYIATQLEQAGLKPSGPDGSFFQWVRLIGLTPDASIVVGARRHTLALEEGKDFVAWPERPESVTTVDGDVVYVGYGVDAPEWQWDDFKRTPLVGKVLLVQLGDPGVHDSTIFHGRRLTYFGTLSYKLEQAARVGAAGVLLIHSTTGMTDAWTVVRDTWSGERLRLDRPATQTLRFAAWVTSDAARRLVEATGKDYDLLLRLSRMREFRPVDLGAHLAIDMRSRVRRFQSPNVIAKLDGAGDRRDEGVIVTAHYDHYGLGAKTAGDSIYNGAIDNASGVASLLTVAEGLGRARVAPARSIVFLATTAHEWGMLGAASYAATPIIPLARTAAVIDLEQANLWGVTRDVVALRAEMSTLGASVTAAAEAAGLALSPDPDPQGARFHQSSGLPLAQAGLPVVSVRTGVEVVGRPPGWAGEQHARYLAERHHRPADQLRPEFDYAGALQQARFVTHLVWRAAQDTALASWLAGSEFWSAGQRLRGERPNR